MAHKIKISIILFQYIFVALHALRISRINLRIMYYLTINLIYVLETRTIERLSTVGSLTEEKSRTQSNLDTVSEPSVHRLSIREIVFLTFLPAILRSWFVASVRRLTAESIRHIYESRQFMRVTSNAPRKITSRYLLIMRFDIRDSWREEWYWLEEKERDGRILSFTFSDGSLLTGSPSNVNKMLSR